MPHQSIHFQAISVECDEAMDYEIVRVTFDTVAPNDAEEDEEMAEETDRSTPYLMLSVNFDGVRFDFHNGHDYHGGYGVSQITLWRDRVQVIADDDLTFNIGFNLSEKAFKELRNYLKILAGADCFRE